jgi:hypothetical protein
MRPKPSPTRFGPTLIKKFLWKQNRPEFWAATIVYKKIARKNQ